ncbi:MAG: YbaK/ebsC protein [Synergistales bacterium 57_84]|nr:MAG: YbaK/ebsC protein [Synergistales bacterium 57_84]
MKKTNAVRLLESRGVAFELWNYESDHGDVSARAVAAKIGLAPERIFKTLVARGDRTGVILACVGGDSELDLKALAAASGNKKVEMVHMREIQSLTGYIRGGVSPQGRPAIHRSQGPGRGSGGCPRPYRKAGSV